MALKYCEIARISLILIEATGVQYDEINCSGGLRQGSKASVGLWRPSREESWGKSEKAVYNEYQERN